VAPADANDTPSAPGPPTALLHCSKTSSPAGHHAECWVGRGAGARGRPIGGRAAPASMKSSGDSRTVPIHVSESLGAATIAEGARSVRQHDARTAGQRSGRIGFPADRRRAALPDRRAARWRRPAAGPERLRGQGAPDRGGRRGGGHRPRDARRLGRRPPGPAAHRTRALVGGSAPRSSRRAAALGPAALLPRPVRGAERLLAAGPRRPGREHPRLKAARGRCRLARGAAPACTTALNRHAAGTPGRGRSAARAVRRPSCRPCRPR
jgi:hypothetical protein